VSNSIPANYLRHYGIPLLAVQVVLHRVKSGNCKKLPSCTQPGNPEGLTVDEMGSVGLSGEQQVVVKLAIAYSRVP
jgi:hypothetical protein